MAPAIYSGKGEIAQNVNVSSPVSPSNGFVQAGLCTVWPSPPHLCWLLPGSLLDLSCHLPYHTNTFSPACSVVVSSIFFVLMSSLSLTFLLFLPVYFAHSVFHFFVCNFWWLQIPAETCATTTCFFILSFFSKCLNNPEANILGWLHSINSRTLSPLLLA